VSLAVLQGLGNLLGSIQTLAAKPDGKWAAMTKHTNYYYYYYLYVTTVPKRLVLSLLHHCPRPNKNGLEGSIKTWLSVMVVLVCQSQI